MSRHPEIKWAEREDKVFLTVLLPDAKNVKVNVEPEGVFNFTASAGADNHEYELKLELLDKVNVEESKINIGTRSIFCVIEKEEQKWWSKLLRGNAKPPHYVKVDWDKWVDEDEEPGKPGFETDGMDFSSLGGGMGGMENMMGGMGGGMGGMGGMESLMAGMGGGGMGGMPGMESLMASMGGGGMGGMPGMGGGGMGGMPGMGDFSMGDDGDDSGDEDQEVAKPEGESKAAAATEPIT